MSQADYENKPDTKTLNQRIYDVMLTRYWYTPYCLQQVLLAKYGVMVSDSSISARIRDQRKARFGGHTIEKRKREGSRAYEYKLVQ